MNIEPVLEDQPSDDQKERLESFLVELMLLSRKYQILLHDRCDGLELVDVPSGHMLGLGLAWFMDPDNPVKVVDYVPVDSILDGCWVIDTPAGPVEQRAVQNTYPMREAP